MLKKNPTIQINRFLIEQVSTSESLGVYINENLSWECHVNEICEIFLPLESQLNVYNSLV